MHRVIQIIAQADDAHNVVLAKLEQGMVPSDNHLSPTGECALQNAIARLILDHVWSSPWLDEEGEVRHKHGDMGEFFRITRRLAGEDTEQLVKNRLGDNELILLLDNAPRGFAIAAECSATQGRAKRRCYPRWPPELLRFRLQSHWRLGGCSVARCEIDAVGK